jgi:hypothetical protein
MARMRTRAWLLLALVSCAEPVPSEPPRVRIEPYLGVPSVILEAPGPQAQAVVMPDLGGRIVRYSLEGENILWDNPDASGRPRPGGGCQVYVGPEPRTVPEQPALWKNRYRWATLGNAAAALTSEPCPVFGLRVERQITIDPRDGSLAVVHRMKNVSDRDQSYCFWDRTLTQPRGFALIPLNPKSRFPARWVIGKRNEKKLWDYDGTNPSHPGIRVLDGVLVAQTGGPEQKVGADSDGGWIAYARGRLLFVKYYPYAPDGRYTDAGLSVALYFRDNLSECEPISPEVALKPGAEYVFPEKWILLRLEKEVTTHEEARALVDRLPPSPFVTK